MQQIVNGLVIGSTYAVVAVGFSMVFTVLRVINFAHPDIFMLGMFAGLAAGTYVSHNMFVVLVLGTAGAGRDSAWRRHPGGDAADGLE
ncbi:MAG: ABC transporter permease subunit [Terriglobales bacterium]